jgi:hypothetical protein
MRLQALQRDWLDRLYTGAGVPRASLRDARDMARFGIYRASLVANLTGALADTYPVVRRLVGAECFDQAARCFIPAHRSASGDIHAWGRDFPDFVRDHPPLAGLPYLPDTARLEWLAHEAFHAAGAAAIDLGTLAELPEGAQPGACLHAHPSLRLLRTDYPVRRIWQVNQEGYAGDPAVDLDEGGEHLAIFRDDANIAVLPMAAGEWHFLRAVAQGETLAGALDLALCAEHAFDAAHTLHVLFGHGLIAGIAAGSRSPT